MHRKTLLDKEFHFGIGFLNELLEGTGLMLNELSSQDDAVLIPKIMFYSLLYSHKRSGKEIDFTMNTIFDMIDDNGGIGGFFWTEFQVAFYESMHKDVPSDDSKKKVKAAK